MHSSKSSLKRYVIANNANFTLKKTEANMISIWLIVIFISILEDRENMFDQQFGKGEKYKRIIKS